MIWKLLGFLVFTLVSAAYFLHLYNIIGFVFTVKCLFMYGFAIAVWAACSYIIKEVFLD